MDLDWRIVFYTIVLERIVGQVDLSQVVLTIENGLASLRYDQKLVDIELKTVLRIESEAFDFAVWNGWTRHNVQKNLQLGSLTH